MIQVESSAGNVIRIRVTGKVEENDFLTVAPQIEQLNKAHGKLRLLVDASGFEGWANPGAAGKHFTFVKQHHTDIEKIAVVAGHFWHYWLAEVAGVFVQPEIKVFDKGQLTQADAWLRG